MWLSTGTPEVGPGTPGPVEILLYPLLGILLAGLIAGLLAAVSLQLLRPWTGAGLRPPQSGYAPWHRLRAPVGFSVLGAVTVSVLGRFPAWVGVGGPTGGTVLRVLVVGVLLGVTLHWIHFGTADPGQRRAGRSSYGVFVVVWSVTMAVFFTVV